MNVDYTPDPSHDGTNDTDLALERADQRNLVTLGVAERNVPHGHLSEDTRFRQAADGMRDQKEFNTPQLNHVFQDSLGRMLSELGESQQAGNEDVEDDM